MSSQNWNLTFITDINNINKQILKQIIKAVTRIWNEGRKFAKDVWTGSVKQEVCTGTESNRDIRQNKAPTEGPERGHLPPIHAHDYRRVRTCQRRCSFRHFSLFVGGFGRSSKHSKTHKNSPNDRYSSKHSKTHKNTQKLTKTRQNSPKLAKTRKTHKNSPKLTNAHKRTKTQQNSQKKLFKTRHNTSNSLKLT